MSTVKDGDAAVTKAMLEEGKALLEAAAAEEEQLELLEEPSTEDLLEARDELGPDAGSLTILRHAREKRRGRRPGVRNRRTEDFRRYILSFGQDPAITLAQIQSTPENVLVEASKRTVVRLNKAGNAVMIEESMTLAEAISLRVRCAEALMPYVHSKQPVAIDTTIRGVRVVEEFRNHDAPLVDGGLLRIPAPDEFEEVAP